MGTEVLAVDADELNEQFWNLVKSPSKEPIERIELLEMAVKQHPNGFRINILGGAYYRLGRFQDALDTLMKSMPMNMTGEDKSIALPADAAFLALSHLKLRNNDEAAKYRAMFDEAMKTEKNSKDEDNQSFQREIDEAFGP